MLLIISVIIIAIIVFLLLIRRKSSLDFFENDIEIVKTYNLTQDLRSSYEYNYNFNPSGVYVGENEFIVTTRGWYGNIRSWEGKNIVYVARIKINENDIGKKYGNVIKILPDPDVEDARLFKWNNELWIICNGLNDDNERHMFLTKLTERDEVFGNENLIELCPVNSQNFEKNWSPLILKNEIYFVYSITPFIMLKYEKNGRNCLKKKFATNKFLYDLMAHYSNNIHIRGGTPFIQINENEWISVAHSVIINLRKTMRGLNILTSKHFKESLDDREWLASYDRLYLMFFYTIKYDKGNFFIDKMSYMFQPPFLRHDVEYITFPSGLTEDNDNYYLFFGENDTESMMTQMNKKFVLSLLRDIRSLKPSTYVIDTKLIEKIYKN